jgi:hypothetical protein
VQRAVDSEQWTENREQRTENREQRTENREQRTENREQRTENREQRTENREQAPNRVLAGGFPGRSVVFGDPQPVDPSCFAAFPKELAARKTGGRGIEGARRGSGGLSEPARRISGPAGI